MIVMTSLARRLREHPVVDISARELGLILVYLFGSQARGTARPDSDLDLGVLLDDRREWSPQERLYRLDELGERVARALELDRDRVDVQDLAEMPTTVALGIAEHGQCLFEGEPHLDVCYRAQLLSRYQDFEPTETMFRKAMHRRLAEGRFGR